MSLSHLQCDLLGIGEFSEKGSQKGHEQFPLASVGGA